MPQPDAVKADEIMCQADGRAAAKVIHVDKGDAAGARDKRVLGLAIHRRELIVTAIKKIARQKAVQMLRVTARGRQLRLEPRVSPALFESIHEEAVRPSLRGSTDV